MEETVVRKKTARKVARNTAARKAPTRVVERQVEKRNLVPFFAIGFFLVVVGVSVAVGFSDSGQINVEATINNKRSFGTEEEKAALENIPVQRKRPSAPNGGLVPAKDPSVKPPASAPVTVVETESSASSTDETASSTGSAARPQSEEGDVAPTEESTDVPEPASETPAAETAETGVEEAPR